MPRTICAIRQSESMKPKGASVRLIPSPAIRRRSGAMLAPLVKPHRPTIARGARPCEPNSHRRWAQNRDHEQYRALADRKTVVRGKGVPVRDDLVGLRFQKKKSQKKK